MRAFFRLFWMPLYRRWALARMRRERNYQYAGIRLRVPPGVFHPGFYFSTPIFIDFLKKQIAKEKTRSWKGRRVLDVGTGSGLLALFAAQQGAQATALDINPLAVETARRNAAANGLTVPVLESDLFEALPAGATFDYVLVNPPYYPRRPGSVVEQAFFAGENLEYFERFFKGLPPLLHAESRVWMVLSEDCDLEKMLSIAERRGFTFAVVFERRKWGERLLVMEVLRV